MADLAALIDQLDNLTLLEASELVSQLEEKWGVSAAAPAAMAMPMMAGGGGGGGDEGAAEEQTEFDVMLAEVGDKKINVIKAVRGLTSLGLKEAKEMVEGAPVSVMSGVSKEAAEEAKSALEAEGASVQIK